MSSQLSVRLGVLEPQILHLPPDVVSLGAAEEAIELADAYGVAGGNPLDESQKLTLRSALGERADGSWAASTVADFEPRQNGKNDTCAARELAGLILFGERLIIHTAHEFPTANESFLRLVAVFEAWDDLRKKVARIRYANGEQGIELLSGQRLKYRARTGGSGRGFAKADLVVYDEAQHLQAEHVAASGPARLANPNNQSWYMGSGGLSSSAQAWRLRRRALLGGAGRLAYVEHTAERVEVVAGKVRSTAPDPTDRAAWAAANPAYERRLTDESMASLFDELGPELFARECLCVWDREPGGEVESELPGWSGCLSAESKPTGSLSFALDVSVDRRWSAFAAAGGGHAEVVDHLEGTAAVVERAKALRARWGGKLAVAASSPAASLIPDLKAAGVEVEEVSTGDHAKACGTLFDAVTEGRFRHRGQPPLDAAVVGARRKAHGDAWLWTRAGSAVDICPLVAVTLAFWLSMKPASGEPFFAVT